MTTLPLTRFSRIGGKLKRFCTLALSERQSQHENASRDELQFLYANACHGEAQYPETGVFLERVIETRERLLGEEDSSTQIALVALSLIHLEQGQLKKAEKLSSQVFQARIKSLGEEHVSKLTSMSHLAMIYSSKVASMKHWEWRHNV